MQYMSINRSNISRKVVLRLALKELKSGYFQTVQMIQFQILSSEKTIDL